jgi:phosphoribosylformylglycinamidine synthase
MSQRRWGVVQFPGSNCDHDTLKALSQISHITPVLHWHEEAISPGAYEVIILPGGFSFGDYLRAGAIAKQSEAMRSLPEAVKAGAHCMGICNGFQILLEAKLLPGFLHVNSHLRFVSETSELEISAEAFPWFKKSEKGQRMRYPIAHRFGNFQISKMDASEAETVLRYIENPNGSFNNTAGIYRKEGKGSYFGLMPHPERASFEALRLVDGLFVFQNAAEALA